VIIFVLLWIVIVILILLMSSKAKRAEGLLGKIGEKVGIGKDAQRWLITTLDPFHDNPETLAGPPDGVTGNQICQLVKQSMTITCPTGITTGTWDVNIVDWPWVNAHPVTTTGCVGPGFAYSGHSGVQPTGSSFFQAFPSTGNTPLGGLQAFSGPTGACLSPYMTFANLGSNTYAINSLTMSSTYTNGDHRVYSKGFEVHNTTAQLYRGGSLTCYRTPVPHTEDAVACQTYLYGGGPPATITDKVVHKTLIIDGPPGTPASALLLPQSKQWGAEEGAYVVSALHDPQIGVYAQEAMGVFLYDSTSINNTVTPTPTPLQFGSAAGTVTGLPYNGAGTTVSPLPIGEFDISGCYFTGLTPQTTLVINWNVYVQRFPTNSDLNLVVLANPSCEREEAALAFYSHAVGSLPVGVPVKENGFGDWFKDVVSTASDYIAPVLSAIPHPAAQGIGMAIKGVDAVANREKYTAGAAANASPYLNSGQMPRPLSVASAAKQVNNSLVRNRNSDVKAKNALIRAKNEEIRARKALKNAKKK